MLIYVFSLRIHVNISAIFRVCSLDSLFLHNCDQLNEKYWGHYLFDLNSIHEPSKNFYVAKNALDTHRLRIPAEMLSKFMFHAFANK